MTLDELEALAAKATPGPWEAYRQDEENGAIYFALHSHQQYEFITNFNDGRARANSHYIAACSPEYILGLIRVVRAARMYASSPDELEAALKAITTPENPNE